ncbi:hypothetical protein [Aulosira sp. FACHB-615]|nr:hypothetical protein [Aulosira sp. FACHB-615]MBD2492485.1 hypothetical protein [Aulosira sp. FACHB-615]
MAQLFYSTDLKYFIAFVNGEVVDIGFNYHVLAHKMGIRTRPKGFKNE